MSNFEIKVLPSHNEVIVRGRIDRVLVASILDELRETEDFPHRNAIWILEDPVDPPSFDEFTSITREVQRHIPSARVDKRVGLVGSFGTVSSMLELWRSSATELPFKVEIFRDYENAVHWVT